MDFFMLRTDNALCTHSKVALHDVCTVWDASLFFVLILMIVNNGYQHDGG